MWHGIEVACTVIVALEIVVVGVLFWINKNGGKLFK